MIGIANLIYPFHQLAISRIVDVMLGLWPGTAERRYSRGKRTSCWRESVGVAVSRAFIRPMQDGGCGEQSM